LWPEDTTWYRVLRPLRSLAKFKVGGVVRKHSASGSAIRARLEDRVSSAGIVDLIESSIQPTAVPRD